MNNQEKFKTRSSETKRLHRNPFRSNCSLFVFNLFLNWKYLFWYIFDFAGGWVIKHFSPGRFPETKLLAFWPYLEQQYYVSKITLLEIFILLFQHNNGALGWECFQKVTEKEHQGFEYIYVKGKLAKKIQNLVVLVVVQSSSNNLKFI